MGALDLAEHVIWLPPGCALWRAIGGPLALTPEDRSLSFIEFRLRVLEWHMGHDKGKKPEPPQDPPYSGVIGGNEQSRRAAAFLRRHAQG
jgi:hypothetical protein